MCLLYIFAGVNVFAIYFLVMHMRKIFFADVYEENSWYWQPGGAGGVELGDFHALVTASSDPRWNIPLFTSDICIILYLYSCFLVFYLFT